MTAAPGHRAVSRTGIVHERLAVFCIFCVVAAPDLLAYTDPGSGSLLLQLLMASLAGSLFHFRSALRRLWTRLRRSLSSRDRDA